MLCTFPMVEFLNSTLTVDKTEAGEILDDDEVNLIRGIKLKYNFNKKKPQDLSN